MLEGSAENYEDDLLARTMSRVGIHANKHPDVDFVHSAAHCTVYLGITKLRDRSGIELSVPKGSTS